MQCQSKGQAQIWTCVLSSVATYRATGREDDSVSSLSSSTTPSSNTSSNRGGHVVCSVVVRFVFFQSLLSSAGPGSGYRRKDKKWSQIQSYTEGLNKY